MAGVGASVAWAKLRFLTIECKFVALPLMTGNDVEALVLFHCSFLAIRSQERGFEDDIFDHHLDGETSLFAA
jgi:hypothetical protein